MKGNIDHPRILRDVLQEEAMNICATSSLESAFSGLQVRGGLRAVEGVARSEANSADSRSWTGLPSGVL
eukprot:CAMPEP_0206611622 /NCGR_PEP_ID=MMETSP0325_2-20121206/55399_1 /ASSEMBLY_ACC=CAM_ASM_000347 /TAXON_ID=2866 /ORGANISM="Crypthecodinium cohnii, Strain Seligo" /LENGTH=68 /DNA_ID=CAMNT_0054130949 /DNA_START=87 /DNA_END=291 /DNA_ORIENTATION=+